MMVSFFTFCGLALGRLIIIKKYLEEEYKNLIFHRFELLGHCGVY